MSDIWSQKYRPKTVDDYVWKNSTMRAKVKEWLADGRTPSLLLEGKPGTGKTSLCYMLLNEMKIPACDILYINASRERGVDAMQSSISGFINTWAMNDSGLKYIILDECDAMSPTAQKLLRAEIEQYSDVTRFYLTANYLNKIIPPLQQGRFQVLHFDALDRDEYIVRLAHVLENENVDFDFETLESYVDLAYPDMRKAISLLSQNTLAGKLGKPKKGDEGTQEYMLNVYDMFKNGKYLEARKLIVSQAQAEEYPEIYRFLYNNLELFGATQEQQDDALIIIRNGLYKHALISDCELNLACVLVELTRVANPL